MEIEQQIHRVKTEFSQYCSSLTTDQFFFQPEGKWSPAQQVKHLITATNSARLAFTLPRFVVRWIGGRPNRDSRSFEELAAKYKMKLEQGGRASGIFIPKPIPASFGKEKLLNRFAGSMEKFARALKGKWEEPKLDQYLAPHPLLGKITLRELCYFTAFHTQHHLHSIMNMTAKEN